MSFEVKDLIDSVRKSRAFFFRHLAGLTPEQWDWKPYPECKSIRQTIAHMIVNDTIALKTFGGGETTWQEYNRAYDTAEKAAADRDIAQMLVEFEAGHEALLGLLIEKFSGKPLDTPAVLWLGPSKPIGFQIPHLSTEDHYHAGQVAFIRLATDPGWDYYPAVYGE